jgi:hypothetical protein
VLDAQGVASFGINTFNPRKVRTMGGGGGGNSDKFNVSILLAGLMPAKTLAALSDRELNIMYSSLYHELVTNDTIRSALLKKCEAVHADLA